MIAAPTPEAQAQKESTPETVNLPGHATNGMLNTYHNEGVNQGAKLAEIIKHIGPAVLIPIPKGQKGPKIPGWQKLTLEDMTPEHHAGLAGGNVGVLLGEASGGLISIDADSDEFLEAFLDSNSELRECFITKGRRGGNVWLRMRGRDYPKTSKIKTADGAPWGEWRADGGQTVIYGTHPDTGNPYDNNGKSVFPVKFEAIKWPTGLRLPWVEVAKVPAVTQSPPPPVTSNTSSLLERARAYVDTMPAAIQGHGGSDATFNVAKKLVHDFDLPHGEAMTIMEEYNTRCVPPWSVKDLIHKLDNAAKCSRSTTGRGQLAEANRPDYRTPPQSAGTTGPREPRIRFFKPSELRAYSPDHDAVLFGEEHIIRGEVFIIGGEPGVGKSTAATELAIAGAMGRDWLGLKNHGRWKTLIIQSENGRYRLQKEYAARGLVDEIEGAILVSEPPPYGMTLANEEFLADVKDTLDSFKPDLVIFDPWNAAAKDDKARDYSAAFDALRAMLPIGSDKPALGIVAHTRKPAPQEKRTGGTALLHLLAGSYVLTSVPRAVFIMLRGSTQEEDNAVVWCNCKNNNGPLAPRTAWERAPSGFTLIDDFDWKTFDEGEGGRKVITLEDLQEALGGDRWKHRAAVEKLMQVSGCKERACQKALSSAGAFAEHLADDGQWIGLQR